LSVRTGTPPTVLEAGIDTARLLFELPGRNIDLAVLINIAKHAGKILGSDGTTIWPSLSQNRVAIECHPGTVLGLGEGLRGHGAPLCPPDALPDLDEALRELLRQGEPANPNLLGRCTGLSRVDTTVSLGMATREAGLAALAGAAVLDVPRLKPAVYGRPIETVYQVGKNGQKYGRWYDWGISRGLGEDARGLTIRIEGQHRFRDPLKRPRLEQMTNARAQLHHRERFVPLHRASQGITCAGLPVIAERLGELVAAGEMTRREAERLIGTLALEQTSKSDTLGSRRTRYRRRAELRRHGLAIADDFYSPVEVDLSAVLDAALGTEAWGRHG